MVTSVREVKEMIRSLFEEAFNTGNMELVDRYVAESYLDHSTFAAPVPGVDGFKQRIQNLKLSFPDLVFKVDDIIVEADRVAFRWTARGTDTGGFLGRPPTGKPVELAGMNMERISDGKIAEHWSFPDNLSLVQQLGFAPAAGSESG
ncbi:MAG: ester cyclase [Chloroflexi bacterium]|nr:ester cyclase [Chloroflexota bacterium]